jgi:hypothetical protein
MTQHYIINNECLHFQICDEISNRNLTHGCNRTKHMRLWNECHNSRYLII